MLKIKFRSIKMTTKTDEIRIQNPEPTRSGGFSVSVSFKRASWSNFARRKFRADTLADAVRLASHFVDGLPGVKDWRTAAQEPRPEARQPVKLRTIRGWSISFSKARQRFIASVYVGRDRRGKRINKVFKTKTEQEAKEKLARFIEHHNGTLPA